MTAEPVTRFGLVLFPGFQALDVFGPIDALNILSGTRPLTLSVIAAALDPVPTKLEGSSTRIGQTVVPTHTFDDCPEDIEVLLVPGGQGTRVEPIAAPAREFVKKMYPRLRYLLTVCTGSVLVAQTGLLDGRRATSNKRRMAQAITEVPRVQWVRKARWVVDGNIWTSSGISAGTDMMYAFIADQYGEETAKELAHNAEYIRNMDPDDDQFA
ncbi:class I glutamine amidotransferase-like protein [Xylariaceae sp. FL1019]|nr:class I glutamine amidotransferase-like protein [Xylariaceae sp. FL1019]